MTDSPEHKAVAAPAGLARMVGVLVLFGIAFGYLEAAVVVYLRAIYDPMRQQLMPDQPPGDLFPLITLDQLEAQGAMHLRRLITELGREAATLVMIAAVAAAVARTWREGLAAFVVVFGIWDIVYYVFLKVLIDWPASLLTWDILFLLPVPWVGPVLAPVLVSITMLAFGLLVLARERCGRPVRAGLVHWAGLIAGGVTVVLAFCWDHQHVMKGAKPHAFAWPVFALGLTMGAAACLHALTRPTKRG